MKNKNPPLFVKLKRSLSHLLMANFSQSGLREFFFRFNNPLNNSDFIKNAEAKLGFLFGPKQKRGTRKGINERIAVGIMIIKTENYET